MLVCGRVGAGRIRFRTLAGVGACVILALAAAGCGGDSTPTPTTTAVTTTASSAARSVPAKPRTPKQRYELAMRTLGAKLSSSLQIAGDVELAEAGKAKEAEKDAQALGNARVALRSAAAQLARIVVPAPARPATALLLKGVREYADELGGVIDALNAGGAPVAVLQQIYRLKGVLDMQRASIELERKGYDIVG
jgi:hypothetical protein